MSTSSEHKQPAPVGKSAEQLPRSSSSSPPRTAILVVVLLLLLGALWYDYKVARPSVEQAYQKIDKINTEMNTSAGKSYMTSADIRQALNREPSRTYEEGNYQVEVYSWRSGFPLRTHDYFAVYYSGDPLIFSRHYQFSVPPGELGNVQVTEASTGLTPAEVTTSGVSMDPAAGQQPSGEPTPAEPAAAAEPAQKEPAAASAPAESPASESPAKEPEKP